MAGRKRTVKQAPMKPIPVYLSEETISALDEMKWTQRRDRGVIMRKMIEDGVKQYQKTRKL